MKPRSVWIYTIIISQLYDYIVPIDDLSHHKNRDSNQQSIKKLHESVPASLVLPLTGTNPAVNADVGDNLVDLLDELISTISVGFGQPAATVGDNETDDHKILELFWDPNLPGRSPTAMKAQSVEYEYWRLVIQCLKHNSLSSLEPRRDTPKTII